MAHAADPDLVDRFIPKPFRPEEIVEWLVALNAERLANVSLMHEPPSRL